MIFFISIIFVIDVVVRIFILVLIGFIVWIGFMILMLLIILLMLLIMLLMWLIIKLACVIFLMIHLNLFAFILINLDFLVMKMSFEVYHDIEKPFTTFLFKFTLIKSYNLQFYEIDLIINIEINKILSNNFEKNLILIL